MVVTLLCYVQQNYWMNNSRTLFQDLLPCIIPGFCRGTNVAVASNLAQRQISYYGLQEIKNEDVEMASIA